jgi:hypothetical protein
MFKLTGHILIIFLYLATFACQDDAVQPEKETVVADKAIHYLIAQGKHESDKSEFKPMESNRILFKAKFDQSAVYQTTIASNQEDINKLYGVADCDSFHQTNSARFGWRWLNGKLEIWGYTYNNGARSYTFINTVRLDEYNEYEIEFTENKYIFRVNGTYAQMNRSCSGAAKGYKLYPYFGGDETAPHDVNIWIEDVEPAI